MNMKKVGSVAGWLLLWVVSVALLMLALVGVLSIVESCKSVSVFIH